MCAICPRQSLALGTPQVMAPQLEQGSRAGLEGCFTLTITILTGMKVQPAQTLLGQGAGGRMASSYLPHHIISPPAPSCQVSASPGGSQSTTVGFLLSSVPPFSCVGEELEHSLAWLDPSGEHIEGQPGFGTGPSQGAQGQPQHHSLHPGCISSQISTNLLREHRRTSPSHHAPCP